MNDAAARKLGPANRDLHKPAREPVLTQIAGFLDLFVWLLVLKAFFLPLFIIPTGSMAETLRGAHAVHTCPNCGRAYAIGPAHGPNGTTRLPRVVQCPNCRWQEATASAHPQGLRLPLRAGDRIMVHGWTFDFGGRLGPRRWDVVVFKNPNDANQNYIKRLIGLPGETIEILDGDVFVARPGEATLQVARKTHQAQEALWFCYFDQDFVPRAPGADGYSPRWVSTSADNGWSGLSTRAPLFDGLERAAGTIEFTVRAGDERRGAKVQDVYGYDGPEAALHDVSDVRVGADLGPMRGDGYVELSVSKYADRFFARLYADGRLTLEAQPEGDPNRRSWAETRLASSTRSRRFSLGHADYQVVVAIDGRPVLTSDGHYGATREQAAARTGKPSSPRIQVTAERVRVQLAHLRIDRDIHYIGDPGLAANDRRSPANGAQGHPIHLPDDAYFVMGDNSPASLDGRLWSADMLGPHLKTRLARGEYAVGTVPADQMIGRAFLVYWPGFLPLVGNLTIVPDLGSVRWIH